MAKTAPDGASPVAAGTALPGLDADQLADLLHALPDAHAVELKASVPDTDRRPVLTALGVDPLKAGIRQVAFSDTSDLALYRAGVTVRARRTQDRPSDVVLKLRPMEPGRLSAKVRRLPGFKVEIDASVAGFVCSCSIKREVPDDEVMELLAGRAPALGLLDKDVRAVYDAHAPEDVSPDDMRMLGPVHVLKQRFTLDGFSRRLVAELWFLPDGQRFLELSSRCAPAEAFQTAAEMKVLLAQHGVDLTAPQSTKTSSTLTALAANLPLEPRDQPRREGGGS